MGQQGKGVGLRGRAAVRYRYLFLLATACGAGVLLFSLHSGSGFLFLAREPLAPPWDHRPHVFNVGHVKTSGTIDTEGCSIPILNPFAQAIEAYIFKPIVQSCNLNTIFLLNNDTHIWIGKEYLSFNICCCYKAFYRSLSIVDVDDPDLDNMVEYKSCIYFSNYIEVINEFVAVSCEHENTTHEQFFIFAPKKLLMKRSLYNDVPPQNKPWYNVIIIGLDAISRLNFLRTMPKTVAYLKVKGAVEFMGYNKVGDNTFPNLAAVLLGVKQVELQTMCWPHIEATFDNCPFIWERFKNVGYYTALAEDSAELGMFNFAAAGFISTPTDYYTHNFIKEAEQKVGNNIRDNTAFLCMGNKFFYQVLLDYIINLTTTLKSSKLFGFFWEVSMSHDYLNYPMHMDDGYEEFLKKLDSSQYLDNTILIFMSDHGIRWGDIRFTKQGRLEERLPLLHMLVPPSFRKTYSKAYGNLRLNSKRLTTPFDVHATLVDLADLDRITDKSIQQRTETAYSHGRSISLFLPVPSNRTCETADIEDHWCTCHKRFEIATDSRASRKAAMHLIRHLNSLLRQHPECARLKLGSVLEARELVAGTPDSKELGWREYLVVVRAEPGGGVFEATLRREPRHWSLAGTVSRLNLYGDQSHCVHHMLLKLYCYCQ